jgi:hypothetical protein
MIDQFFPQMLLLLGAAVPATVGFGLPLCPITSQPAWTKKLHFLFPHGRV